MTYDPLARNRNPPQIMLHVSELAPRKFATVCSSVLLEDLSCRQVLWLGGCSPAPLPSTQDTPAEQNSSASLWAPTVSKHSQLSPGANPSVDEDPWYRTKICISDPVVHILPFPCNYCPSFSISLDLQFPQQSRGSHSHFTRQRKQTNMFLVFIKVLISAISSFSPFLPDPVLFPTPKIFCVQPLTKPFQVLFQNKYTSHPWQRRDLGGWDRQGCCVQWDRTFIAKETSMYRNSSPALLSSHSLVQSLCPLSCLQSGTSSMDIACQFARNILCSPRAPL